MCSITMTNRQPEFCLVIFFFFLFLYQFQSTEIAFTLDFIFRFGSNTHSRENSFENTSFWIFHISNMENVFSFSKHIRFVLAKYVVLCSAFFSSKKRDFSSKKSFYTVIHRIGCFMLQLCYNYTMKMQIFSKLHRKWLKAVEMLGIDCVKLIKRNWKKRTKKKNKKFHSNKYFINEYTQHGISLFLFSASQSMEILEMGNGWLMFALFEFVFFSLELCTTKSTRVSGPHCMDMKCISWKKETTLI